MAIEKNNVKVVASRVDTDVSIGSRSRDSMSSDEGELVRRNSVDSDEDDDDDEFDDADSGAGSDDFDLLELGETGSEFCQVGDQTCCIPFELYDLTDLRGVLSLDVWNEYLTEDERFGLTKYLPDMDQEAFMRTLKELFEGGNFHFGNPVDLLYQMLKGGLCEPRVALYRQGLNFFQMHQHYHRLHKHQDSMVFSLMQMRDAWQNCKGYGIGEKLRVLNIMRSQKSLMGERNEDMGSDSSDREESANAIWNLRLKGRGSMQKVVREPMYGTGQALDVFSHGRGASGKPNSRLLMADLKPPLQNEQAQCFRHGYQGTSTGSYGPDSFIPRGGRAAAHHVVSGSGDDDQERMYAMASQRDWNVAQGNMMDRAQAMKRGKKRIVPKSGEYDVDSYSTLHSTKNKFAGHGRNLNINQLSDIEVLTAKPSNVRGFYDPAKRARYGEPIYGDQMDPGTQRHAYFTDPSFDYVEKVGDTRKMNLGKEVPNSRFKNLEALGNHIDDRTYVPENRSKVFQDNIRGIWNDRSGMFPLKSERMFHEGEDTESDSSEQLEEGDKSHLIMPNRALHGCFETPRSSLSGSVIDKKEKRAKKSVKGSTLAFEGILPAPSTMGDFDRHMHSQDINNYYLESRQSSKTQHPDASQNFTSRFPENHYYGDLGNTIGERNKISAYILARNGQIQGVPVPINSALPFERRLKDNVGHVNLSRKSKQMQDYSMEENGVKLEGYPMRRGSRGFDATLIGCTSTAKKHKRKEGLTETNVQEASDYMQSYEPVFESISLKNRGKRRQVDSGSPGDFLSEQPVEEVVVEEVVIEVKPPKKPSPLITPTIHTGFSFSVTHLLSAVRVSLITPSTQDSSEAKKHLETLGAETASEAHKPLETLGPETASEAQKPLENLGAETTSEAQKPNENLGAETAPEAQKPLESLGAETASEALKPLKNLLAETTSEAQKPLENHGVEARNQNVKHEQTNGSLEQIDVNNPAHPEQTGVPSLTVHEIVNRVRSNPGDPSILETQEPLQDLVRGVLKVFSSKTAPLGAKGWKPLISYDRSTKCWSWTGPVPQTTTDNEPPEEVTSPEAWGIPRKMLVKLVDSFANWLKCGQETLQQIGSLPAPPAELMQLTFDEKERFKDLRAQKSLPTFSPSTDDVRAYFRKEEHLRYSVPDRAFSYTAADGKKSIVAPLRRCGGKSTSKARDHFMLKPDRPPHVTILCLVRDAAARLPGSIGTRADVCTLIRDSQYMVEDVSDAQVNQVISGALDRLHYERDPCVQFDGERKLWVYLHREREEEDFEDDGTSSTKKWKRPTKSRFPASEQDEVMVVCPESVEPTGLDPSSDLNVEPPCMKDDKVVEPASNETIQVMEDDPKANHMPEQGALLENASHCLVNTQNEDFNDKT